MGYIRSLPKSDDGRESAMTTAKNYKDLVGPSANVLSASNSSLLDAHQPLFIQLRSACSDAEEKYKEAQTPYNRLLEKLKNKSSHGLQLVNFKIVDEDEGFPITVRVIYRLPLNGNLPKMHTAHQIMAGAEDFIQGETTRVSRGETALTDIKWTEVQEMLNNLRDMSLEKGNMLLIFKTALSALKEERKKVDTLISNMWDDIEHAVQGKSKASRHKIGKIWGMTFEHTSGTCTINVHTEDADSHLDLAGVDVRIGVPAKKRGTKRKTNTRGAAIMESRYFNATHIIATHILYETLAQEIKIKEGGNINVTLKMKKKIVVEYT